MPFVNEIADFKGHSAMAAKVTDRFLEIEGIIELLNSQKMNLCDNSIRYIFKKPLTNI